MDDVKYMQEALELARRGIGLVEPNPAVGCVIVKDGEVIGRGWHRKFGGAHAEINAIVDCRENGKDTAGAKMYVTLEPCAHHGKTPPCADAVVKAKPAKVVIAAEDPSDQAAGGVEKLKQAGVRVKTGICRREAVEINRAFFKYAGTGLPWVTLKWAQSIDGKMAYREPGVYGQWLSNEESRKDVHALRRQVGAILVGSKTVVMDDPRLTVRPQSHRQPLRVVLDTKLVTPPEANVCKTEEAPTLVVTTKATAGKHTGKVGKLKKRGVDVLAVEETAGAVHLDLRDVLEELGRRGVQHLMVEGGATVLTSFLKNDLADEVRVYVAPKILAGKGRAGISEAFADLAGVLNLSGVHAKYFKGDVRISGYTPKGQEALER